VEGADVACPVSEEAHGDAVLAAQAGEITLAALVYWLFLAKS